MTEVTQLKNAIAAFFEKDHTTVFLGPLYKILRAVNHKPKPVLHYLANQVQCLYRNAKARAGRHNEYNTNKKGRFYLEVYLTRGELKGGKNLQLQQTTLNNFVRVTFHNNAEDENEFHKFVTNNNITILIVRACYATTSNFQPHIVALMAMTHPKKGTAYVSYCAVSSGVNPLIGPKADSASNAYLFPDTPQKPNPIPPGFQRLGLSKVMLKIAKITYMVFDKKQYPSLLWLHYNKTENVAALTAWLKIGFFAVPLTAADKNNSALTEDEPEDLAGQTSQLDAAATASPKAPEVTQSPTKKLAARKSAPSDKPPRRSDRNRRQLPMHDSKETDATRDNKLTTEDKEPDNNSDENESDEQDGNAAARNTLPTEGPAEHFLSHIKEDQVEKFDMAPPIVKKAFEDLEDFFQASPADGHGTHTSQLMRLMFFPLRSNALSLMLIKNWIDMEIETNIVPEDQRPQVDNELDVAIAETEDEEFDTRDKLSKDSDRVFMTDQPFFEPRGQKKEMDKLYAVKNKVVDSLSCKTMEWIVIKAANFYKFSPHLNRNQCLAYAMLDDKTHPFTFDVSTYGQEDGCIDVIIHIPKILPNIDHRRVAWFRYLNAIYRNDLCITWKSHPHAFPLRRIRMNFEAVLKYCDEHVIKLMREAVYGVKVLPAVNDMELNKDTGLIATWYEGRQTHREPDFLSPGLDHPARLLPVHDYGHTMESKLRHARVEVKNKATHETGLLYDNKNPLDNLYTRTFGTMKKWTEANDLWKKHVLSLGFVTPPPALSKYLFELCKFRWVVSPTDNTKGYFEGLARIPNHGNAESRLSTNFSHLIVGVPDDKMMAMFYDNETFVEGLKTKARDKTLPNQYKFVYVPPGDSASKPKRKFALSNDDETSTIESTKKLKLEATKMLPKDIQVPNRLVVYQQNTSATCFVNSMCNALHVFGLYAAAKEVNKHASLLTASSVNLVSNVIQKANAAIGFCQLVIKSVSKHPMSMQQLTNLHDTWPVIVLLASADGGFGQHAVAVYNGLVYEPNSLCATRKCKEAFDWACGVDSKCVGGAKVYQLLPKGFQVGQTKLPTIYSLKARGKCWLIGKTDKKIVKVMTLRGMTKVPFEELQQTA